MICQSCHSNRIEFSAEINVHFPGWSGLSKPTVWVFPKMHVCLKCGLAEFVIPPDELHALEDGIRKESRIA
jgi:hypothetical protein